jgi:hypothetical protein
MPFFGLLLLAIDLRKQEGKDLCTPGFGVLLMPFAKSIDEYQISKDKVLIIGLMFKGLK